MSQVRRRRQAILDLIGREPVGTQEELVKALAGAGFRASQSSISRDVAALGLVKAGGRYVRPAPSRPSAESTAERIRANVLEVRPAGDHLLVLVTPPGEASPVALALDRSDWPEVLGTVAGDDTLFVAVRDARAARALRRRLRALGLPG